MAASWLRTAIRVSLRKMNFASDNTAPVAPAILDAIVKANEGFALGYGNDDWTAGVERRLAEVFEREVAVFLVPTGTAANALALAQVTPPWGVVFCHAESHIATDECGAPEFFGGGLKLAGLPGGDGKIAPQTLQAALAGYGGHRPHQMVASALSLTQASEAGTIYRIDEIARLSEIAHARSLAVHMDGARFANALVRLNTTPAQMTWQSGIDVLSFGATKGGAMAAEAVVVFDPGPRRVFRRTAQARRPSVVKAPLHRRANGGLPRRRLLARAGAPRQCHGRPAGPGPQVGRA